MRKRTNNRIPVEQLITELRERINRFIYPYGPASYVSEHFRLLEWIESQEEFNLPLEILDKKYHYHDFVYYKMLKSTFESMKKLWEDLKVEIDEKKLPKKAIYIVQDINTRFELDEYVSVEECYTEIKLLLQKFQPKSGHLQKYEELLNKHYREFMRVSREDAVWRMYSPEYASWLLSNPMIGIEWDGDILQIEEAIKKADFDKYECDQKKSEYVAYFNRLSDYLYDYLILKIPELINVDIPILEQGRLADLNITLTDHVLHTGKYGKLQFQPNKSPLISREPIGEQMLSYILQENDYRISFEKLKKNMPSFTNNDFHTFKRHLNETFREAFSNGKLQIKLVLINHKSTKRGNPVVQLYGFKS